MSRLPLRIFLDLRDTPPPHRTVSEMDCWKVASAIPPIFLSRKVPKANYRVGWVHHPTRPYIYCAVNNTIHMVLGQPMFSRKLYTESARILFSQAPRAVLHAAALYFGTAGGEFFIQSSPRCKYWSDRNWFWLSVFALHMCAISKPWKSISNSWWLRK